MDIRPSIAAYNPRRGDFRLREQPWRELPNGPAVHGWFLNLGNSEYYIALGMPSADLEAEAAAMEQLAEIATEAARLLRARAASEAAEAAEG